MKYRSRFVAFALLAGSAAGCLAQTTPPTIFFTPGTMGTSNCTPEWNSVMSGWDCYVEVVGTTGVMNCRISSAPNEPINDITIDFNDNGDDDVQLFVYNGPTNRCGNIRKINMVNIHTGDLIIDTIFSDGNVGGIRAHRVISADMTGNLGTSSTVGGIFLQNPTSGTADVVRLIIGGHLLGRIKGDTGSDEIDTIKDIQVTGNIGQSTDHSTIEANRIENILADHIYADITLDTTGSNGKVRRIQTRDTYDFVGSLTMSEFHSSGGTGTPGLFIGGDLDANLNILDLNVTGEIVVTDVFATGNLINIDGDLAGDITLGNSGLVGQIICNSANGGDTWTGTVKVGGTTLTDTPLYQQTGLGGGAVGLVAFDCHYEDCVPTADSSTAGVLGNSSTNVAFKVKLTHYGPVTWTSGMPIQVLFCPAGGECDPVDVTSDFEVTSSKEQRFVVVEPIEGKPDAGVYHLSPKVDVKCFGISAGTPPSVVSYTYDPNST